MHIHRAVTKQRHVTAGWHALENTIRMGGHCAVISRDHILYRIVTLVLCTRLYRRDWSRMLAYFQKKKTGFCLGTDSQRRERASEQGVLLWGLGFGGRVGPVLFAFHLHADDTLYHYMEGRCSYWYVNTVLCVLWLCDQVNQASVVGLYLDRRKKLKFTQMRSSHMYFDPFGHTAFCYSKWLVFLEAKNRLMWKMKQNIYNLFS